MDNPLAKDPCFMALWCWILLLANHEDGEWKFGYQKIAIKKGQFITGRKALSIKTGINESKIERILKYLESEQQIEQQKTTKYRLIIIKNWYNYEIKNSKVNNKRTTSEQQVNTNNNDNNDKNVKKSISHSDKSPDEINLLIEKFKDINPSYQTLFRNKTERRAAGELIKQYGLPKMLDGVDTLLTIISKPYAPKITTPYQLQRDMGKLKAYIEQDNNSSKKRETISI